MELEEKPRPNRTEALKKLNLDPSYFYVLHPALFHYNKNQAYSFELAKNLLDRKVKVLFAGNFCFLNELNLVKPDNAILLGEINNLDDYYSCVDLCILPSLAELNPIVIKESLSHQLLCYVSDLEVYKPKYVNHPLIRFIQGDNLFNYIVQNSEPKDPTAKTESRPYFFVENQMLFSFNNSAKVEIVGSFDYNYLVQFIDQDTGAIAYQTNIRNNMWSLCNPVYFVNWKIVVTNLVTKQVTEHKLDFKNKKISIINESGSLGDCLAWVNSISRFATKHNIIVDYFTAKHDLFSGQYANVRFYPYSDKDKSKDYYATYSLVCDHNQNTKYCKKDWRTISLQNFAAEVLGVEYKEERAKINLPPIKKKKFEKYVCLATQSTLQNRYYNKKDGWRDIVRYLRQLGYKIVVIDKHMQFGSKESMNTVPEHDYFAGNDSFNDIIDLIRGADFCVTLSSGHSWLSFTLNKPCVVISGAVADWYEFSNPYRVQSKSELCSGCFNRSKLDASDWLFCPDKKDFICTKSITFEMVKEKIDQLVKDIR
jgi:autotransporter strand-loop-strand O-heptosyltransferase